MYLQTWLFKEANRNTAAIMECVATHLADGDIEAIRKRVGDILHDSRRQLCELMEENDEAVERRAISGAGENC